MSCLMKRKFETPSQTQVPGIYQIGLHYQKLDEDKLIFSLTFQGEYLRGRKKEDKKGGVRQ